MQLGRPLSDVELAYAGGFFDGEGSVLIYRRSKTMPRGVTVPYQIRATLGGTNKESIYLLREWFGGSIYARPAKPRLRAIWKWTVLCRDAAAFLRAVRPYLRIKGHEADLALAMQDTIDAFKVKSHLKGRRGQLPLPPEELAHRDAIHGQLIRMRRPEGLPCDG